MSHTAAHPQFEDNGSGRCFHCGKTSDEHVTQPPAPLKWPRALTRTVLRGMRIFNSHDILAPGEPAIVYHSQKDSLSGAGWRVTVKGKEIPGPWYEYGGKSFVVMGSKDKEVQLILAKRYVEENHDPVADGWVRNPWGDWVPYRVVERLMARHSARKKAAQDA